MRAISTDNVLCSSFCSDCFYQVLCFLVSLCSHSKQHQYGLLLVLFTSLCFDCVSLCSSSTHYQSSLPLLLLTSSQSSHLPRSAPDDFLHTTAHCFNKSLSSHLRYIKQVSSIGQVLANQVNFLPNKSEQFLTNFFSKFPTEWKWWEQAGSRWAPVRAQPLIRAHHLCLATTKAQIRKYKYKTHLQIQKPQLKSTTTCVEPCGQKETAWSQVS